MNLPRTALTIFVVACVLLAIPVTFPRVANGIPVLLPLVHKARSFMKLEVATNRSPTGSALATHGSALSPEQLKFIQDHQRRHDLLSAALKQQQQ